jgi:hypothetical protein
MLLRLARNRFSAAGLRYRTCMVASIEITAVDSRSRPSFAWGFIDSGSLGRECFRNKRATGGRAGGIAGCRSPARGYQAPSSFEDAKRVSADRTDLAPDRPDVLLVAGNRVLEGLPALLRLRRDVAGIRRPGLRCARLRRGAAFVLAISSSRIRRRSRSRRFCVSGSIRTLPGEVGGAGFRCGALAAATPRFGAGVAFGTGSKHITLRASFTGTFAKVTRPSASTYLQVAPSARAVVDMPREQQRQERSETVGGAVHAGVASGGGGDRV